MNTHDTEKILETLTTAGNEFSSKHSQGVNISLYVAGEQEGDKGLFKIEDLAYRGDKNLPTRSSRMFYSLAHDEAVILTAMKEMRSVLSEVSQESLKKFGGNPSLAWVYAFPIFKNEAVVAVICFSGSSRSSMSEGAFKGDIEHLAESLIKTIIVL